MHMLEALGFLSLLVGIAADDEGIVNIAATPEHVVIEVGGLQGRDLQLIELRPYQEYLPDGEWPVAWAGELQGTTIEVPRLAGRRDRLFSKFQLVEAGSRQPIGTSRYVTDLSLLEQRDFAFPWPDSIKGLSCIVMLDDAVTLGAHYHTDNIWMYQAFDWASENPPETWEVDGERIPINAEYFRGVDQRVKRLTDAGINVTMVLNNALPRDVDPGNPLIHPRTDLANAPTRRCAFNLTDERGLRYYRGLLEYMAHRYSDPRGEHGWISGYIVGNEVQVHWEWYNMGEVDQEAFIRDYVNALRITDLAVRKIHAGIRVYVSMDHHWNQLLHAASYQDDPLRSIRGPELLEGINARARAEGNFPWHLAFHPYPENLREPRSWLDPNVTFSFDTPKITFKNIEVLPAFLRQPHLLYEGQPRRIILSEQGFDTPAGPDGETIQAACYAYAYYRVSHTPGIDAFMLHRHVDARDEGGLRLGLWTWDDPPRKKKAYEVFRLADTEQWQVAFEFARPIIGIEKWEELLPRQVTAGTSGAQPLH